MRDKVFQAVEHINSRMVYSGLTCEQECYVPLVEITSAGGEIAVYFLSFCLWDSANSPSTIEDQSDEGFEKYLMGKIDEIRTVVNHVTSGITPALASATRI